MDDIEKNRVEYVQRLEEQIEHLQRQLAEAKPLADKWTPKINGEISPDQSVRVTLSFGGKMTTAVLPIEVLTKNTVEDITYSISNTLAESLFIDRVRGIIQPEVERLVRGAAQVPGAGKW